MSLTPSPSPAISVPASWRELTAATPPLRSPRIHWHRMGTWY